MTHRQKKYYDEIAVKININKDRFIDPVIDYMLDD